MITVYGLCLADGVRARRLLRQLDRTTVRVSGGRQARCIALAAWIDRWAA